MRWYSFLLESLSQVFSYEEMRLSWVSVYTHKHPTDEMWKTDAVGRHSAWWDSLCGLLRWMSAPSPTRSICYPALILLSAPRGRILWTTPMGYLVPWCYLQGAQEDVGEKEESEVRELVLGAPSWGVTALVGHFWPKFPTTAPSPHLISSKVTALKAAPPPWSP